MDFCTLMILGLDSCELKVVAAPALPSSQDEDKIRQGAGRYWWLKLVHPYRVKSFRKAVSTVMDKLGNSS